MVGTEGGSADTARVAIAETCAEKERIYAFRYQIYVDEMGKKKLACADASKKILRDDLDDDAVLYYVEADGELAGTLRVNIGAVPAVLSHYREPYRLDRFAEWEPSLLSFSSRLMVSKRLRGSRTLYHLLTAAYEVDLRRGVRFDFCNCAPSLVDLYEHLGYRRYTDNFVDPEVGYRVPMVLVLRAGEHLEAVRSPFRRVLRSFPSDARQDRPAAEWLDAAFPASHRIAEWMLSDEDFWRLLASKLRAVPERKIPLLEGLTEDEAKELLHKGAVLKCRKGEKIIRESDVGSEMYVVLSGLIQVMSPTGKTSIAVFGRGQVVGEIGLLLGCERSADVVAVEDTEVLVIDRSRLERLIRNAPGLASKALLNLCRMLCERLVASTRVRLEKEEEEAAS